MKTLLLFPPTADPAHPPLGIASLAGFLRSKGEQVSLMDLNLVSYYRLLSGKNLEICAKKMKQRIRELERQETLSPGEAEEYRLNAENSLSGAYLIRHIDGAFIDLKRSSTYRSYSHYKKAASLIKRGMEFVSAAYYPVRWYSRGFSMGYLPTKGTEVITAIRDEKQNLFIPFYDSVLPEIVQLNPDIIGISINYYCQLIPGLTLADRLKRGLKKGFIVVGGGLICFFDQQWEVLHLFKGIVDGFIPFEGEIPLFHLTEALRNGNDLSTVPGLVYFKDSSAHFTDPAPPPDLSDLPSPDFKGLPLGDYISPEIVLPTLTSRGCYWGRCAFCSHAHLYRGKYRRRPVEQVINELKTLSSGFNAHHFYFTDECILPADARELAHKIISQGLPFRWFVEIRFERILDAQSLHELKAGGCKMLMFGLESGEDRVLKLMDKGITPDTASKILRMSNAAGIRNFVMFFTGFPTESRSEAEKTIEFIEKHRDFINQIAFANFILEKRAIIYSDFQSYGISRIQPYEGEDLKIYVRYEPSQGLSAEEAVAFLDEIKNRPNIHLLLDTYLLSRSHLIFLPQQRDGQDGYPSKTEAVDLSEAENLFPRLHDRLVSRSFVFNLDQIDGYLQGKDRTNHHPPIGRFTTNYLYDPEKERLVEVGEDGLLLIKPCTGEYSLADILDSMGEQNRQTALSFYRQLHNAGFLFWEGKDR